MSDGSNIKKTKKQIHISIDLTAMMSGLIQGHNDIHINNITGTI